jgi:D-alanyl-D-alanine endopeptidase (penicillin-binding protein 7)
MLFCPAAHASLDEWLERPQQSLELASLSAAVIDIKTGVILYEKNPQLVLPIASITKVLTTMVILDANQSLDENIRFTDQDRNSIYNSHSRIRVASEISREEALRLALMSSENLAAAALANNYPGGFKAFIKAMNNKAYQLGMFDSHFVDASGLSVLNRSSVKDLASLLSYIGTYPLIKELSTTVVHTAYFKKPRYRLGYTNTNGLVRGQSWPIEFSKTGYLDKAGHCLVMITQVSNRSVGIVLLDAYGKKTPLGDARRIKTWLKTGKSQRVSDSARHYQRQKLQSYASTETF